MVKRIILITLGFGALILGGVGVVLPILPTTPFVLCAAGCFGASSPGLYKKLANTRYFGEYIRNYMHKTGISNKARYTGIAFLWGTLLLSGLLARRLPVTIALLVVGACVTIHIATIRRSKPGQQQAATKE